MSKPNHMQTGQIDPAKLDAAAKPRRKRRNRNRPEPAAELRDWEVDAEKRAFERPYPPGIMLEPAGFDEEHWTAPHSDAGLWTLQLADAFGTRSSAVISTFMRQLEELCQPSHWDDAAKQWRLDENQFSAALAIVNSVKPRNEMEAALAAQMVAVHLMTMKVSARALKYDYDTRTAATASKLARTFTTTGEGKKTKDNPMDRQPQLLTNAPLCGAMNRAGNPCRCPAMKGKKRCRMHGGAKGSGAPKGERNGMWKHGGFSDEAIKLRQLANKIVRVVQDAEASLTGP